MDKATLVKSDIDISALILDALSRTKMPVTLCDWRYSPQLEVWQLVIATPWVDEKGLRATYRALIDALTEAGVYEDTPIRRVFMMSPNDPVVQELEREARTGNDGFIHILRHNRAQEKDYWVLFAPITGIGGPVLAAYFFGEEPLRNFLADRVHLGQTAIEEAFRELGGKRHASIYPVHVTTQEIKKFVLA